MRTACLINHYNYGSFIKEAVDSVLAQTHPLDEIIVVDDGSDSEHLEKVRSATVGHDRVQLIEKKNGGQLSCFVVGVEASTADLVWFLDADDLWEPTYVEQVCKLFESRPDIGFVATQNRKLHADGRLEGEETASRDLGYSVVRVLEGSGAWVGAPTSSLALRREVLKRIFPVPNPQDWSICADEVLVYGASLVGARKYFLGEPLVRYRVHGANAFYGKKKDYTLSYWRHLTARRLVTYFKQVHFLPDSLAALAHYEFRTLESPTHEEYRRYCELVWKSGITLRHKIRARWGLFSFYRLGKMA
jgi:glycosyltransferase involved in cell wall biosynthesis